MLVRLGFKELGFNIGTLLIYITFNETFLSTMSLQ